MADSDETNTIRKASESKKTEEFQEYLRQRSDDVRRIVTYHFRLSSEKDCVLAPGTGIWKTGGFNVSISVYIKPLRKTILVRCPMAHKLGEPLYPENVDEKCNAEVATYVWMQQECPDIPIAHLHGFQLPDGRHFTHAYLLPPPRRILRRIQRYICTIMRWPIPSWYVRTNCAVGLRTGYLIMDFVDGQSLSPVLFSKYCSDADTSRRQNLFGGIAKILLAFARTPLPRIGSWKFHDNGTISLTNRPLSCSLAIQENWGATRVIQPGTTYANTEPYILDLISCQYNRFIAEPNAVNNEKDCRAQLAIFTILRAVLPHYFDCTSRNGPFIMTPTDFNLNNLLVDDQGNIRHLIDLEFYCSLPVSMSYQLRWLNGRAIDEITDQNLDEFDETQRQFLDVLSTLEAKESKILAIPLSEYLRAGTKRLWYSVGIMSVDAAYTVSVDHIIKKFSPDPLTQRMYDSIAKFSSPSSTDVVVKKLEDKENYEREKRRLQIKRIS